MKNLFAILALLISYSAHATLFSDLENSFFQSKTPQVNSLKGYWSGRCAHYNEPNSSWPAVYVLKDVENASTFPPNRLSQSYYTERIGTSSKYDSFTPSQVEADPNIKYWFAQEHWTQVNFVQGSLTNHLFLPNYPTIRSTRIYSQGAKSYVLLRVTYGTQLSGPPITNCYFSKYLGTQTDVPAPHPSPNPAPEPAPIPAPTVSNSKVLIGKAGATENAIITFQNELSAAKMNRLLVVQKGNSHAQITNLRIESAEKSLTFETAVLVQPGIETEIPLGMEIEKITKMSFQLLGKVEQIEVFGALKN